MAIAEALKTVKDNIEQSALKAGRNPDIVKLIAVSKTVDIERIIIAIRAGAAILGENRVQEAREKITELKTLSPDLKVEWHLIGSLQKNKAKTAVQLFDVIHSVDSAALADEINRHAGLMGKNQRILVQVKLADEAAKHGVQLGEIMDLLSRVMKLDNVLLEGLMTMPPFADDPEEARPYFIRLREIADTALAKGFPVSELSMGMSNDYKVAVEEGATMVRVGTFIFGERSY
ncbi:MAG: YggS family pyridoxal phosphate-dependent enzyme [Nitrospiraceae bacterium]|nr:MAG: YggS family pyridoxal phosphate-dependent enzyme [Nitrospiraceae bacterium]